MKHFRKLLLIPVVAVLLTSCASDQVSEEKGNINYLASAKFDTKEFLQEYDSVFCAFLSKVCESDNAFYYIANDGDSLYSYIYFYDKASGITGKLCAKPECPHNIKDCNAYVDMSLAPAGLSVYNNKLYWRDMQHIYNCNLDGTDRSTVRDIDGNYIYLNAGRSGWKTWLHRGYCYTSQSCTYIEDGEAIDANVVFAYELESDSEPFVIYEDKYSGRGPISAYPFRNKLYIVSSSVIPDEEDNRTYHIKITEYDTKTRESLLLSEFESDEYYSSIRYIPGHGLYVSGEYHIGKYNPETEEIDTLFYTGYSLYGATMTDDYIFIDCPDIEAQVVNYTTLDYDMNVLWQGQASVGGVDPSELYYRLLLWANGEYTLWNFGINSDLNIALPVDGSQGRLLWQSKIN